MDLVALSRWLGKSLMVLLDLIPGPALLAVGFYDTGKEVLLGFSAFLTSVTVQWFSQRCSWWADSPQPQYRNHSLKCVPVKDRWIDAKTSLILSQFYLIQYTFRYVNIILQYFLLLCKDLLLLHIEICIGACAKPGFPFGKKHGMYNSFYRSATSSCLLFSLSEEVLWTRRP